MQPARIASRRPSALPLGLTLATLALAALATVGCGLQLPTQEAPCPLGDCRATRTAQAAGNPGAAPLEPTPSPVPSAAPLPSPTPLPSTPIPPLSDFGPLVIVWLPALGYDAVIGNPDMPQFNRLANQYTLLRRFYAVAQPGAANLQALLSGAPPGEDCLTCRPTGLLAALERSGRSWTAYQANSATFCTAASTNPTFCQAHNARLEQLSIDLAAGRLPDLAFVSPDLCAAGQGCDPAALDAWLGELVEQLVGSPALGARGLMAVTFSAGDDQAICCGLSGPGGGRVATLLISPLARQSFVDDTPYTLYSLLETLVAAWGLPVSDHATTPQTTLITAPFEPPLAAAVMVGAGDIDVCGEPGDEATAALLASIPGEIFTLGDNSNQEGTLTQYQRCFGDTWGRYLDRIHPSPGNHDLTYDNGADYYTYFGTAAGPAGRGYYSYDLGDWHIISLNGSCDHAGGCGAGSPQLEWLRADLAASPRLCTLAYWHQPRFSSGIHNVDDRLSEIWQVLYQAGVDVVLNGHDHIYERFAPQDPEGRADPLRGLRQFTVGTGGAFYRGLGSDPLPNSEKIILDTFGVLELSLRRDRYEWRFIPVAGSTESDAGSGTCH